MHKRKSRATTLYLIFVFSAILSFTAGAGFAEQYNKPPIDIMAIAELGMLAPVTHTIQFDKTGTVFNYVEEGGQDNRVQDHGQCHRFREQEILGIGPGTPPGRRLLHDLRGGDEAARGLRRGLGLRQVVREQGLCLPVRRFRARGASQAIHVGKGRVPLLRDLAETVTGRLRQEPVQQLLVCPDLQEAFGLRARPRPFGN